MLILLSVILLVLAIVFFVLSNKSYAYDELFEACAWICVVIFVICVIALIFNGAAIANADVIDQKIALYEEENAKIEEEICQTVANYLDHEEEILTNLTPETATTILAKYPELKSDSLVAAQMETYIDNHEELQSLREDKINIEKKKWWVYFG